MVVIDFFSYRKLKHMFQPEKPTSIEISPPDDTKLQACQLTNNISGSVSDFKYREPIIYRRGRGREIESEWTGSTQDLMDKLLPKLEVIFKTFHPWITLDHFESYPDYSEINNGSNQYCSQFQTSKYHCTLDIKNSGACSVVFLFRNYRYLRCGINNTQNLLEEISRNPVLFSQKRKSRSSFRMIKNMQAGAFFNETTVQ